MTHIALVLAMSSENPTTKSIMMWSRIMIGVARGSRAFGPWLWVVGWLDVETQTGNHPSSCPFKNYLFKSFNILVSSGWTEWFDQCASFRRSYRNSSYLEPPVFLNIRALHPPKRLKLQGPSILLIAFEYPKVLGLHIVSSSPDQSRREKQRYCKSMWHPWFESQISQNSFWCLTFSQLTDTPSNLPENCSLTRLILR